MNQSQIFNVASEEVSRAVTKEPRISAASKAADTDYLLASQVRQGNLVAVGALVEKYRQPIINFASRLLGDPTEAHDVAQNVFVQVLKKGDRFQSRSKFSTWLYAIARNLCHNEHRRRLRQTTEQFEDTSRYDCTSLWPAREDTRHKNLLGGVFEWEELQQKIEESLATLPQKQRTAILLLMEQDFSYEQIAVTLGTSISATRALIHRGRQELKRKLQPYLRTGAWAPRLQNSGAQDSKLGQRYSRRHRRIASAWSRTGSDLSQCGSDHSPQSDACYICSNDPKR